MADEVITDHIIKLCTDESAQYQNLINNKVESFGQHYTATIAALMKLRSFPIDIWEEGKTFIDPSCGIGQLIVPVAIIKKALNHKNIVSCIYGVDILQKNVNICRERLLNICGNTESNITIVNRNIVCADNKTYDFKFQ